MARKKTGIRQQTGFRANRGMLNRLRSQAALRGLTMGQVIEELCELWVTAAESEEEVTVRVSTGSDYMKFRIPGRQTHTS